MFAFVPGASEGPGTSDSLGPMLLTSRRLYLTSFSDRMLGIHVGKPTLGIFLHSFQHGRQITNWNMEGNKNDDIRRTIPDLFNVTIFGLDFVRRQIVDNYHVSPLTWPRAIESVVPVWGGFGMGCWGRGADPDSMPGFSGNWARQLSPSGGAVSSERSCVKNHLRQ